MASWGKKPFKAELAQTSFSNWWLCDFEQLTYLLCAKMTLKSWCSRLLGHIPGWVWSFWLRSCWQTSTLRLFPMDTFQLSIEIELNQRSELNKQKIELYSKNWRHIPKPPEVGAYLYSHIWYSCTFFFFVVVNPY